jgi:hypothetical protein
MEALDRELISHPQLNIYHSDEDFRDLVAYLMYLDELSDEQAHEEEKHSEPHQ